MADSLEKRTPLTSESRDKLSIKVVVGLLDVNLSKFAREFDGQTF